MSYGEEARRNPLLLFSRITSGSGLLLLRLDTRQLSLLFHEPPRNTRCRQFPFLYEAPVIGFLLGGAIILLAQVNLFTVANAQSSDLFWIGLSVLVGFGTPDVVDRLHKVSETIFGANEKENPPAKTNNQETVTEQPPPGDEAGGNNVLPEQPGGTEKKKPVLGLLKWGK
ncbi:MAG: hypothetical protein R2830_19290 [Saprospiraceae bacterium]